MEGSELSITNSFQNRVINSTVVKVIPKTISQLDINIEHDGFALLNESETFYIGYWYQIDGQLVKKDVPVPQRK